MLLTVTDTDNDVAWLPAASEQRRQAVNSVSGGGCVPRCRVRGRDVLPIPGSPRPV